MVTFNGESAKEDWYAVALDQPVTVGRVVFLHGRTFHDGGWFDTSAGKPKVQIQATQGSEWKTVGELADSPLRPLPIRPIWPRAPSSIASWLNPSRRWRSVSSASRLRRCSATSVLLLRRAAPCRSEIIPCTSRGAAAGRWRVLPAIRVSLPGSRQAWQAAERRGSTPPRTTA